jgi:type II restriction/modification system DNA methylase subunit YeeA
MEGSSLSCLVPFDVLRVIMTLVTILLPEAKSSLSYVFSSVISPSHTSLVSFIFIPIDLLKFYINTSVFFTSEENTSEATIGQNGTLGPNY